MTKEQPTIYVGIDVSKDKLAVALAGGGQPTKSDGLSCKSIEIEISQVTIRLDGTTSSDRIAEIVRAIGARP